MAKRLSWLVAGHQSAPGVLEWLPSSSKSILTHIVGWKQGCASLQVAHHNLTWHLYFLNKLGIVLEVGGNGEARVFSIADVAGYSSIFCLSLHIAATAQHRFTSFFRNFKPSDIETSWY